MPREANVKGSGKDTDSRSGPTEAILRAKYLDYCSARVADALLRMTPDEMFLLAQSAEAEPRPKGQPAPAYSEIVRLATGRISTSLALPDFANWAEEYRRNPQRFEAELLGLWKIEVRDPDEPPS
jgi:hypothetical protein